MKRQQDRCSMDTIDSTAKAAIDAVDDKTFAAADTIDTDYYNSVTDAVFGATYATYVAIRAISYETLELPVERA